MFLRNSFRQFCSANSSTKLKEIKCYFHKPDVKSFSLEKIKVIPDQLAVAKWIAPPGNPYGVPANNYSWGVWEKGILKHFTCYRMHSADGKLEKYRLDVIGALDIDEDQVVYRDLLLDCWIFTNNGEMQVKFEDEDEFMEIAKSGKLTEEQIQIVESAKNLLLKTPQTITNRIDEIIAGIE